MTHISIPSSAPCELRNFTPVNPLISRCEIKVCYVGDTPNRNGSVITKEVAEKCLAPSLGGSPIVGKYNEEKKDFEEHNRIIEVSNGELKISDATRPYGFVPPDAKVWFQTFNDDGIDHEYLCTEGYIWTGAYPESQRIITWGNNQSMELADNIQGEWSKSDNGEMPFFIINEALISKLCILGEDVEPCFEGAGIAKQFSLSLDEDFKQTLFSMMRELKEVLDKGGKPQMNEEEKKVDALEEEMTPEETEIEFQKKPEDEEKSEDKKEQEDQPNSEEDKKDEESDSEEEAMDEEEDDDEKKDHACGGCGGSKKKKKYELDEIPEYVELNEKFSKLTEDFDALQKEVEMLREFKAAADRKTKQEMIDGFYMLSDEDKKDCVENIDKYSLDDIEAKLSIICVRNKVSFSLEDDKQDNEPASPTVYNLGDHDDGDTAPAWIKAVRNTAKNM